MCFFFVCLFCSGLRFIAKVKSSRKWPWDNQAFGGVFKHKMVQSDLLTPLLAFWESFLGLLSLLLGWLEGGLPMDSSLPVGLLHFFCFSTTKVSLPVRLGKQTFYSAFDLCRSGSHKPVFHSCSTSHFVREQILPVQAVGAFPREAPEWQRTSVWEGFAEGQVSDSCWLVRTQGQRKTLITPEGRRFALHNSIKVRGTK